jgi:hypothetical protein
LRLSTFAAVAVIAPLVAGCAVADSHLATGAQKRLLGMSEVDMDTCLGAPDQHASIGATDVLTWYTTSSSSVSWSLPIVQGPSYTNGGNCHMTARFDNGIATRILYSGEKNATAAPSAYCAPIVRSCIDTLDALHHEKGRAYPEARATP